MISKASMMTHVDDLVGDDPAVPTMRAERTAWLCEIGERLLERMDLDFDDERNPYSSVGELIDDIEERVTLIRAVVVQVKD